MTFILLGAELKTPKWVPSSCFKWYLEWTSNWGQISDRIRKNMPAVDSKTVPAARSDLTTQGAMSTQNIQASSKNSTNTITWLRAAIEIEPDWCRLVGGERSHSDWGNSSSQSVYRHVWPSVSRLPSLCFGVCLQLLCTRLSKYFSAVHSVPIVCEWEIRLLLNPDPIKVSKCIKTHREPNLRCLVVIKMPKKKSAQR